MVGSYVALSGGPQISDRINLGVNHHLSCHTSPLNDRSCSHGVHSDEYITGVQSYSVVL